MVNNLERYYNELKAFITRPGVVRYDELVMLRRRAAQADLGSTSFSRFQSQLRLAVELLRLGRRAEGFALLTQIEEAMGLQRKIGLTVLIETAVGMVNVDEVAQACPDRMEAMIFGVADYAASMQSHTASIGGSDAGYAVLTDADPDGGRELHWGDQWHYALARIAVACRANGLRPRFRLPCPRA